MTDWAGVRQELQDAGYPGFEFKRGETPVPGLSGEWVAADITREGGLKRENQPLLYRVLDALPALSAVATDPEDAPERLREIADGHGLKVVIVSTSDDEVHIALCEPSETNASP